MESVIFPLIPTAYAGVIAEATPISTVLVKAFELLLTISGTIGIISLVIAGVLYLIASHSGDQSLQSIAKKSVMVAMVGMIIIMGVMIVLRTIAQMLTGGSNW